MKHHFVCSFLIVACALRVVQAENFAQWLDSQSSTELSISAGLAKNHDGIQTLSAEMPNLMIFLPENNAWTAHANWVKKFEDDPNLRYDMILASGTEIKNTEESAFASLKKHQARYGMLDSGYGTPYFLFDDRKLCLGVWNDRTADYEPSLEECSTLSSPVYLDDAVVFRISAVILPPELTINLDD